MAMTYNSHGVEILLSLFLTMGSSVAASGGSLYQDIDLSWGGSRSKIVDGGKLLTLTLDKDSGSGFQSKRAYLFGRIDMDIKLVGGDSAGTVTAFYLSSEWPNQDEIDFEFLGNLSGDPYTVHTNVYTQGKGDREQQFHLWFDPTKDFHKYSILWNPQRIIFLVDNVPIRVYNNDEKIGVSFPNKKPMKLHSSLWNADQWATRGGQIKTNWSQAPFTAYYRNFNDNNACVWSLGSSTTSCGSGKTSDSMANQGWKTQGLDANGRKILRWVQKYYMIYNYCTDYRRFPHGRPTECRRGSRFL